jgi:5-methylcytosine-specific restriction endonuclease McrA
MQFCTTEEHVNLVERAKALLARTSPGASLGELHLQAMKLLVQKLEKQKFAVTARPRKSGDSRSAAAKRAKQQEHRATTETETESIKPGEAPRPRRRSGRRVPAAVKREVFVRDGGCCSYVDERGVRCGETRYLELHHLQPYAQGGRHVAANLTLRCAAHNALAAEQDFGRARVERMRDSPTHESFAALARANGVLALRPDI